MVAAAILAGARTRNPMVFWKSVEIEKRENFENRKGELLQLAISPSEMATIWGAESGARCMILIAVAKPNAFWAKLLVTPIRLANRPRGSKFPFCNFQGFSEI